MYAKIASGNRLTSAANDPAGLAISEKLNSQIKGDEQAVENIGTSKDLIQTADGALNSIGNDLQRVRELAVQANNGILTGDQKSIIQNEINSLFDNIQKNVQNTEFNTIKLLDGSFENKNIGVNGNGQGSIMTIENAGLEALGLDGFSVEGDFDISTIDNAIAKVNESRSDLGASYNGLEANQNNTEVSALNQASARSRIADEDISKAIIDLNKQRALNEYQIQIQKKEQESANGVLGLFV
jgi:flagellin